MYIPSIISANRNNAGVHRVTLLAEEPEDKEYENNIICPYCGYEDRDSWEKTEEDDIVECGQCGAILEYTRVVTVEYTTHGVKPPEVRVAHWLTQSAEEG